MKTWFEWMDQYYEPPVRPQTDEAQTARLKQTVLRRAGTQPVCAPALARPHRWRRFTVVAAAAALACCVGAGALAAVGFPWGGVFGKYFGADAQNRAAQLGMPGEGMALSTTDGGCTLTLNGALFDGQTLYLPLTISFDNGMPEQGLSYYAMGTAQGASSGSSRTLADENPADNSVDMMCTLSGAELQSGQTLHWEVFALYGNHADAQGNTHTVWQQEGNWAFNFTVPQAAASKELPVPDGSSDPATGIAIAQVRLTPMQVSVVFDGLPDSADVRDALSCADITLHFADGSTRTMGTWADGVRAAGGSIEEAISPIGRPYYEVSCEYGQILDPAQITTVEVNGCLVGG